MMHVKIDAKPVIKALARNATESNPIAFGGVQFWIVNEGGPWDGELCYDIPTDQWDCEAVIRDVQSEIGACPMIYCERHNGEEMEKAVCLGWGEFIEWRAKGYSSTTRNNAIADAVLARA